MNFRIFLLLGLSCLPLVTYGTTVTYSFSGTVTSLEGPTPGAGSVGSEVSGTITFDDGSLDSDPSNEVDIFSSAFGPNAGLPFQGTFSNGSISASIDDAVGGGLSLIDNPGVDIFNYSIGDQTNVLRLSVSDLANPIDLVRPGSGNLTGDAGFDLSTLLLDSATIRDSGFVFLNPDGTFSGQILFDLTSISQVPLPAAAWLFLSAIAGLFGMKRLRT